MHTGYRLHYMCYALFSTRVVFSQVVHCISNFLEVKMFLFLTTPSSSPPFLNNIHRSDTGFRPVEVHEQDIAFSHTTQGEPIPKIISIQCRNMGFGRRHMFPTCARLIILYL